MIFSVHFSNIVTGQPDHGDVLIIHPLYCNTVFIVFGISFDQFIIIAPPHAQICVVIFTSLAILIIGSRNLEFIKRSVYIA